MIRKMLTGAVMTVGMIVASGGAAAGYQSSDGDGVSGKVDASHYFVHDGVTITWDDSVEMSDVAIHETPHASGTSSSRTDAEIGRQVLNAYQEAKSRSADTASSMATDYCTFSPDSWGKASFKSACKWHDKCYSSNSTTDRLSCDMAFNTKMISACQSAYGKGVRRTACYGVTQGYYQGVRKGARWAYKGKGSPK